MVTLQPRTVVVEVTQDDIDNGIPGSRCDCPVARAIKRATGANRVSVSPGAFATIFVEGQLASTDGNMLWIDWAIDFDKTERRQNCRPFRLPLQYWRPTAEEPAAP